jgi:glutamine amidotransferase/cyclase
MSTPQWWSFAATMLTLSQFHRGEYTVKEVKDHLQSKGQVVRPFEADI